MKSAMSNATIMKYQPFKYYYEKYHKKLNEPNSLVQPLNLLCGGWSVETFKQVINKLSTNRSSPLPLYFPSPDSMQLITKSKHLREQVFQAFDTRGLKRIDASQLYCALMIVSKGSYQVYLKTIVDVFGFEYQGRIQKDQFFFFLDSLFRAIPKIVLVKGAQKPSQANNRLDHEQINRFIKSIFSDREQIQRSEIFQLMLKQQQLSQFIKFVQKRCTSSAEKCRNETIERATIQAEVRGWLDVQLNKIQKNLNQSREQEYNQIL